MIPLLAGLADLGVFVVHGKPASPAGQVLVFVPGFALIMTGLVIAGPWLTMAGARVMARRASRPGALIAARRLADDPRAAFRAVSGLVLALFIFTVAAALLATQNTKPSFVQDGPAAGNILVDQFSNITVDRSGYQAAVGSASPPSTAVLTRLRQISGGHSIVEVRADPGLTITSLGVPAAVVSCAQLASELFTHHGLHYVPLSVLAIISLCSAMELAFEQHAPGATIRNFGDALWWSVVTATTVNDQALRCIR